MNNRDSIVKGWQSRTPFPPNGAFFKPETDKRGRVEDGFISFGAVCHRGISVGPFRIRSLPCEVIGKR